MTDTWSIQQRLYMHDMVKYVATNSVHSSPSCLPPVPCKRTMDGGEKPSSAGRVGLLCGCTRGVVARGDD
jgi:hypothetical protein